jgi:quercetin dioxygenase-like cupin family protein
MAHEELTNELKEQLTLYALDLLAGEDARAIEQHLAGGCAACEAEVDEARQTAATIVMAVQTRQPPQNLRDRVLGGAPADSSTSQVWKDWRTSTGSDMVVVRRSDQKWDAVAPGVFARQLYVNPHQDTVTMMVRMDPGATYSPHRHAGPEQCFVLEGDLFDGEDTYYAGDFQCKERGSVHQVQSTKGGCLLLIVSSLHDELLSSSE